jgi:hypothetical protein
MYKNHEGYNDPTAAAALSNIIQEEKRNKRRMAFEERKTNGHIRESGKRDNSTGSEGLQESSEGASIQSRQEYRSIHEKRV